MLRRTLLRAAAPAAFSIARGRAADAPRRPNIVLFIADDQRYLDVGCYGSRQVRTPNIDGLAAKGLRFTHAFTGTAMCSPMRQQLYTGIFPVRNGAYPNHSQIKPGIGTLPGYLKDLGYRVALAGKRHFGPQKQFPFEYLPDAGDLPFDAMEEFARRDAKQPYCLVVCSHQPHGPYDKGDRSRHPVDRIRVPDYWVDTPAFRDTLSRYFAEVEYMDGEIGRVSAMVATTANPGNTMTIYSSEQGCGFPFAKWTCYDLGLRQASVVHWPDRVKPGVTGAMVQGVDWLPTMIEAAGGKAPADLDGRSFLGVLEGRSREHAREVFGVHTTRGIINGSDCYPVRSIRTRTHKLILNLNHETAFRNVVMADREDNYWSSWEERARTDAAARRIVERYQHRPALEFYDIEKDPFEQHNLAGESRYQTQTVELTGRLRAWMKQQGDEGVATEMQVKANPRQA